MLKRQESTTILGIDIDSDAVRVVRGMNQQGKVTILDFAQKKFSTQGHPDMLIKNIQDALVSLNDVIKIKKERVYATISGRKLCIRVITLPVIPAHELFSAVQAKIRKYVSPNVEQIYFRFFVLGETLEDNIKKLEIMFVAMQKSVFEDYLRLFEPLKLQPQLITSACFGGWNLIRYLGLHKQVRSVMLININGQETDLAVYRNERFIFTRNISIGAKEFMDMTKEKDSSGAQSRPLHQQQFDTFCKEVELTSHHFYQIMHGERIDKCIVMGEGCGVLGLIDFLKQKIDIPLSTLELPPTLLALSGEKREEFRKDAAVYTQSLGALLSQPEEINLMGQLKGRMKKAIVSQQTFLSFAKTSKAIAIIFIAVTLLMYGTFKGINLYYQSKISALKQDKDKLENKEVQLLNLRRMVDRYEAERNLYRQLRKDYPSYLMIIDQICQAIPSKHIVLDELIFTAEQRAMGLGSKVVSGQVAFSIRGRLLGKGMIGFEVTEFVSALEQSGNFENVSVAIKSTVPTAGQDFDLDSPAAPRSLQGRQAEEVSFSINGAARLRDEQII